jgi:hypothetical protein
LDWLDEARELVEAQLTLDAQELAAIDDAGRSKAGGAADD